MAKCKDCIHDALCPTWDDYHDEPYKEGNRGRCHNYDMFMAKSNCLNAYAFNKALDKYLDEIVADETYMSHRDYITCIVEVKKLVKRCTE